jgi:lipopolysaccharide export system protein LptC
MISGRAGLRFRILAIALPAIALALGSFWLLEVMRRSASDFIPNQERSEPDFYVEKFSYVKLGKTGKVQYHFSGAKLTHNPKDDSYDITLPVINNLGEETMPMTMRSERAHVNSDNSRIQLFNNVQIDRPASATTQHLHATSEYLLVLPDDEVMKTDEPVEITVGASTLSGVGMFADNATREFRLTSNVHGTYQVPQR